MLKALIYSSFLLCTPGTGVFDPSIAGYWETDKQKFFKYKTYAHTLFVFRQVHTG